MKRIIAVVLGIVLGVAVSQSLCPRADVNCDGTVNVLDVQLVINEYLDG